MAATAVHLIIHGRVQGVYYRAWTGITAAQHGIKGWVRNRTDGTVEAVFVGEEDSVNLMVTECRTGPSAARVTDITMTAWDGEQPSDFKKLPTV